GAGHGQARVQEREPQDEAKGCMHDVNLRFVLRVDPAGWISPILRARRSARKCYSPEPPVPVIFNTEWRSSRDRITRASSTTSASVGLNSSLLFALLQITLRSRNFWMKPWNSALSKNSGALSSCSSPTRSAVNVQAFSSSPAPSTPWP